MPSRVMGPGLGARTSVTQSGNAVRTSAVGAVTWLTTKRSYGGPVPSTRHPTGRVGRPRRPLQATSKIASTSTGVFNGRAETPTALRACLPASPKTSPKSSLAPLTTPGCPAKPGADVTPEQAKDLARQAGGGQLAVHHRQLTGDVDVVTGPQGRHVGGDRRHDRRDRQPELLEPGEHLTAHVSRPSAA